MILKDMIEKSLVESFYLKEYIENTDCYMYVQYFTEDLKEGKDKIESDILNKEIKKIKPFEDSILFTLKGEGKHVAYL